MTSGAEINSGSETPHKEIVGVSKDAPACLMSYEYPGNVRELENLIERAFILYRSARRSRPSALQTFRHASLD